MHAVMCATIELSGSLNGVATHTWQISIVQRIKLLHYNFEHQAYLEGFHKFCEDLGGTTADVMCPILQVSEMFVYVLQVPKTSLYFVVLLTTREGRKLLHNYMYY